MIIKEVINVPVTETLTDRMLIACPWLNPKTSEEEARIEKLRKWHTEYCNKNYKPISITDFYDHDS